MKDCKSKKHFKGKVAGDNKSKPNNCTKDKGNYKKVTPSKNKFVKKLTVL